MDLKKLNPWNWFKHEDQPAGSETRLPVKREEARQGAPETGFSQHPVWQLHREIDRLFDQALSGFGWPAWANSGLNDLPEFRPNLDVASDGDSYDITLEAPGLDQKDLNIEVRGDLLVIEGNKREENETRERRYYRVERRYGSFQRLLSLPDDADPDAIEAKMQNGLLRLRIPRKEGSREEVRKVPIQP